MQFCRYVAAAFSKRHYCRHSRSQSDARRALGGCIWIRAIASSVRELRVESLRLEKGEVPALHRANRSEIMAYYTRWLEGKEGCLVFLGSSDIDESALTESLGAADNSPFRFSVRDLAATCEKRFVTVRRKLVDARFLQTDIPLLQEPRFRFDGSKVSVIPINDLQAEFSNESMNSRTMSSLQPQSVGEASMAGHSVHHDPCGEHQANSRRYVVVGGGKTGMDAVLFLRTQALVEAAQIAWIVPNDAWITAREDIQTCMEFLDECVAADQTPPDLTLDTQVSDCSGPCKQGLSSLRGYLSLERKGKMYRIWPSPSTAEDLPTKFKDATLSAEEVEILRDPSLRVLRGRGRLREILDDGATVRFATGETCKVFASDVDGDSMSLGQQPQASTVWVHCAAGAFHFSRTKFSASNAVFEGRRITIHAVFGNPGFCFFAAVIARIEAMSGLTDADRNAMLRLSYGDDDKSVNAEDAGPSGGDISPVCSKTDSLWVWLQNARSWYRHPDLRDWLHPKTGTNRLFNLNRYSAQESEDMLNRIHSYLEAKLL